MFSKKAVVSHEVPLPHNQHISFMHCFLSRVWMDFVKKTACA